MMTRVEQRTLKLIDLLGEVGDLVTDRSRSEAAGVKRAARELASLLKKKPTSAAARSAPRKAARKSEVAAPAAKRVGATKRASASKRPASKVAAKSASTTRRASARVTKDGRSLSDVRRAAAHKAWETKRGKKR